MCVVQSDECDCLCHIDDHIVHLFPCCDTCHYCLKRLKYGIKQHTVVCKAEHDAFIEQVAKHMVDDTADE